MPEAGTEGVLGPAAAERVCHSALRALLARQTGGPVPPIAPDMSLREGTSDAPGLGLDSLQMLEAVADANRRFALHETGVEDYLLTKPSLRDWGLLIAEHLRRVARPSPSGTTPPADRPQPDPQSSHGPDDPACGGSTADASRHGAPGGRCAPAGDPQAASPPAPPSDHPMHPAAGQRADCHLGTAEAVRTAPGHAAAVEAKQADARPTIEDDTGPGQAAERARPAHAAAPGPVSAVASPARPTDIPADTSGPRARITFATSGSTGTPRHVTHPTADLVAEADALAADLWPDGAGAPRRIVALVPCHHIFGFLFAALMPHRLGLPVVDLSAAGPGALARTAMAGDLVIATPHLLDLGLRAGGPLAPGVAALVSGAAAPAALWADAAAAGLPLTEVYGATETGGLGWRRSAEAPFALLSHLERDEDGIRRRAAATRLDVQDVLDWRGGRSFAVAGRRDGVVQVAGVNVSPQAVARSLSAQPGVADAAVRLDPALARLKAFVVPCAAASDATDLEARLRRAMAADHPAAARPVRYAFGAWLPTTPAGKPADWPV